MRAMAVSGVLAALLTALGSALSGAALAQATQGPAAPAWVGDAIPLPLTARPGDVAAGRQVVESRASGLCLLCHPMQARPGVHEGNLAPPLAGVGSRLDAGQLRARLVDSRRLQPASIMPAYGVVQPGAGTTERIGRAWQGRPLLEPQQIEDVVAYLQSLRDG